MTTQGAAQIVDVGEPIIEFPACPPCPDCGSRQTTLYQFAEDAWTLYCDECKREELHPATVLEEVEI